MIESSPSIDPNWIMAIIALIAIVSPIVTAIINNYYQIKLKKLDMYESAKRKALSDFVTSAQAAILNSDSKEIVLEYTSNFDKLFIYFNDISTASITPFDRARVEVNTDFNEKNFQKANKELSIFIEKLSKQISKE